MIELLNADDTERVLPDLIALLRGCVEDGASIGFVLPLEDGELDNYWRGIISDVRAGIRLLWVTRDTHGRVVGSVQLAPEKRRNGAHRADVQKLLVHPDARRKGLGVALMAALEAHACAMGRTLLVLDTRTGDMAEPLYLKLGFSVAGVIPNFAISPDSDGFDSTTYMYKILD